MTQSTLKATIKTNKGDINLNLFPEKTPVTVANFVNLSKKGFYNGISFHRVIDDFMIQTGCPMGNGMGDPGYKFEDECQSELRHDCPGVLSMANAGPGTNGSQFFITHIETPWLDGKHTVFGKIVSEDDQTVVNEICQNDTIQSIEIDGDIDGSFSQVKDRLDEWNTILDEMFPHLNEIANA